MYQEYNLNYNPFTESRLEFTPVNRTSVRKLLKLRLDNAVFSKSCQIYFLLGDYGIGKSFTLRDIENRIKNGKFLSNSNNIIISKIDMTHPKPPSNYTYYLYYEVMKSLDRTQFVKLLKELKWKNDSKLLKNLDPTFKTAFLMLDSPMGNKVAWDFLSGENISAKDMAILGLEYKIVDDDSALKGFIELLKLVKCLDYNSLIIMVDEFEYIFTAAGKQKATQLVMTYRFLYDKINEHVDKSDNIAKIIFIFTSTPHSWSELTQLDGGAPFVQRVNEPIPLSPFSPDETRQLLETRLNHSDVRINNVDSHDIVPFKDDFIDFITGVSRGIPRDIIKNCSLILDIAHQEKIKEVGAEEAKKILTDWGKI